MISFAEETRIVIYSNRYQASRDFYQNIIKLEILKDWDHGDGQLGVVYQLGNAYLEILQTNENIKPSSFYIDSQVKDIDLLWNKLKEKVNVTSTITNQAWGHRNFSIEDPNGYQLKFFSLIEV